MPSRDNDVVHGQDSLPLFPLHPFMQPCNSIALIPTRGEYKINIPGHLMPPEPETSTGLEHFSPLG